MVFSSFGRSYLGRFPWAEYFGIMLQEVTLVHCSQQEVSWTSSFEEVTHGIFSIGKKKLWIFH